jgi:Asp-tRNA(Asn)/Glu-tRNA(Gln) amidotransferase A subunit family amidase
VLGTILPCSFHSSTKRCVAEADALDRSDHRVKDNIDVAGLPTTTACPAFAYRPQHSAFVVEQLIEAGAIAVGKTNLDQFATRPGGCPFALRYPVQRR